MSGNAPGCVRDGASASGNGVGDGLAVLRAIDRLRYELSDYHGQLKAHDDLQRHCDNQRQRIAELEALYAAAKGELADLQSRYDSLRERRGKALPEGVEWPRFADGEPVGFGDAFVHPTGDRDTLDSVRFLEDGFQLNNWCAVYDTGVRPKRPEVRG